MAAIRAFITRHPLWLGFVAVLVPLVVLWGLQYHLLNQLRRTSVLAVRANLDGYLEHVVNRVELFYKANAERALNLPPSMFYDFDGERIAKHFKKKPVRGIRELFVLRPQDNGYAELLYYEPHLRDVVPRGVDPDGTSRAIFAASIPLLALSMQGSPLESASLRPNEDEAGTRIILNPITDASSRLIGIAGMIVDERYLRQQLLPTEIEKALDTYLPPGMAGGMQVVVYDQQGRQVFPKQVLELEDPEFERVSSFRFLFKDWTIGICSMTQTPEQWARLNFIVLLAISSVLAAVMIGGVVMALRAANRELRLSLMKNEFVSNVSHELRTPLSSIRVFAELMRLGKVKDPDKVAEYGEYIETESRRLTQLINNILDFSHIESGHKTYHFEPTSLSEVVADAMKTFEVRLKHTGFDIDLAISGPPLPPVPLDRAAIRQALSNLLDNAVKYSGDSRRIEVRVGREGELACVSVRDYGIGISRKEQERIFDRFHRVGTGLVHDVKGSGLGLAIVSNVVRAHGGRVVLESEPRRGSTFTIKLPLEREPVGERDVSSEEPIAREGAHEATRLN